MKHKEIQMLLTPSNRSFQLHQRDGIRTLTLRRAVLLHNLDFVRFPSLALSVVDESELPLWNHSLRGLVNPENAREAWLNQEFAVYDHLTVSISPTNETLDFAIEVYFETS